MGFALLVAPARKRLVTDLDLVVRASHNILGNFGPAAVVFIVALQESRVFFKGPSASFDRGVQVLAPSFFALFGVATGHHFSNCTPVVGPMQVNRLAKECVFVSGPCPFY